MKQSFIFRALFFATISASLFTAGEANAKTFAPCSKANVEGKTFRSTYIMDVDNPRHNLVEDPKDADKVVPNAPTLSFSFSGVSDGILVVNYKNVGYRAAFHLGLGGGGFSTTLELGPIQVTPRTAWNPKATNSIYIREQLPKSLAQTGKCLASESRIIIETSDDEDVFIGDLVP